MMNQLINTRQAEILLVEDNENDLELTRIGLKKSKLLLNLHHAKDGVECMEFLRKQGAFAGAPRPDLILLDLNMPRMDGRELLGEIKEDAELKRIPVVVLTTSADQSDITCSYNLHANCYVTKPVDLTQFMKVVSSIESFWFTVVKLPSAAGERK